METPSHIDFKRNKTHMGYIIAVLTTVISPYNQRLNLCLLDPNNFFLF